MSVASHAPPARLGEAEAPGLAFIDQAGHLVELNATLAALLGQPRDQLAGRLLAEVVSVWAPILTPIIKQVVATAAPALAVALPAQAAGTAPLAPLVANCYPVQTRCGYVAGVDLVVRQQDIHAPAPKRAADHQMELAGSVLPDRSLQEQQAQLLEQAYEPMLVWELPGRIIAWNRGAEELYGFTSAEALGQVSRELLRTVHPTDVPTFEATLQAAGQWQGELQHTTRDGRRLVVESRMTVVVGADGHARVLEANRDITARHQIEERLRWLQAVTASFAATQTLAQVRQVILDEIRTALGALRVGVRLVTPEALVVEGEVRGPPVAADVHRQASVVPLQTKHPAVETVQRGRPVFLCDAQAFVQRYPDWVEVMRHVPVGASAHLPLARGDEVFGVLTVSFAAPRTWDVGERAFAQALADRAAVAYERARLFDAERQAHERVERLQAVTAALSRAVTPPDVYAAVLQLGVGVMGAATADPALVAHSATFRIIDGDALTLASAIGIEEARLVPYQRIPLSAPLPVADAVRTRQPIWLRSQADYLQQYPHLEGQIRQLPTEAGTCLPLRVEDRVLGALTFTFAHPLTFDADQQGFLLTLADLAAQALERSRLYQAERAARHRLEETSAQLTAVLEAAPVGLLVAQAPGGEVLQRNHQVARIWRQDRSAATVNDVTSGFAGSHPDGRRLAPEEWPLARTLATGAAVADEEIRIVRGDGSPGAILVSSAPIRDSSGTVVAGVTVFADITARKTAEDAWRTSEERFRAFQETSVDGFALLESVRDAAGQIVDFRWRFVNAAAAQFQRKPMDWFFGRSVLTEMPNVRAEGRFDAYVRVVETGESWATELLYRGDGVERYTRLVAAKAGDGFALAFTDLSDRWRAEVQLRASEVRFRALVATIPQIIWTCAPDGRIDYVSEQWTDYTGLAPEQALQGDWQAAIHPDDWPATSEAWAHSLQTAAPVEVKHRLRHRSGEWRWQLVRSIPIRDAAGLLTHWVGTSTDIHASETRERHAQFLLALETELARLSEAAAIEQTTVDRLGVYLALSRCTFSHVEGEEVAVRHEWRHGAPSALSAHHLRNYLSSEAIAQLRAHRALVVEDTLADPRTAAATVTHRAQRTGAFVVIPIVAQGAWVGSLNLVNAQPRVWQVDEVQLVHEVAARVWPLLEQARAQAALRASEAQLQLLYAQEQAARAEAEAASRLKDEFLATVSHELRTPLTAFLGYAQMLQLRKRDEAYVARTVEKMVQSAKAQGQLIEDLLDISRIVSGRLRIEPRAIPLRPVVEAALDTMQPMVVAKGLHLAVNLDPAGAQIFGDAGRLQQVVWNLLANAAKFTPAGGTIRVRLAREAQEAALTVSDDGQGISPDFLPFVFERFRQADSTSKRVHGGLGLGLAIVRHLVELHGGTVQAASAGVGQGATFTVRLPLVAGGAVGESTGAATSTDEEAPAGPPELRGLRVLLVDDQPEVLEILHEMLILGGAVVRRCTSAREALAALGQWRPAVLVSDIAMPKEDGYWLIAQVRALAPEAGGATPAVALTAYVRMEDRLRVLAAGFQRYVPKPVEMQELWAVLAELIRDDAAA